MEENQKYQKSNKKKGMLSILGIVALVLLLGGITYAFFNYTRTGSTNTIQVGRIYFNSEEGQAITLNNLFPIDSTDSTAMNDPTKVGTLTVHITGDTEYNEGIEYLVSAVDVTNTSGSGQNAKTLPISVDVSVASNTGNDPATTLGNADDSYYSHRGPSASTSIYKVLAEDAIESDSDLLVGYIKPGSTGVDGNVVIKAYIDKEKVAISDTYPEQTVRTVKTTGYTAAACETATGLTQGAAICASASSLQTELDSGSTLTANQIASLVAAGLVEEYTDGTTSEWVDGRTVFTTSEWNALQSSGVSFKIKVEANEGIWVENPNVLSKLISRKLGTVNYVASYDDFVASDQNYSTFTTQDQVSTSATKQTVYYYTGNDAAANANVLFAGYCWQIVRTTDNGGVKLIYNGVAVNNKCETTRTVTKGINGTTNATSISLSSASLFGRSYDYNLATGQFTITDSTGLPTAWNNTNYSELIGTYTCRSDSATCTTLYYVGGYDSNTNAYTTSYTIGDVAHFSQMGTSAFNAHYKNPALVGYMFNKGYDYIKESKSGEYYANAVWNGTTYDLTSGNAGVRPDTAHHYICDTNCTKVRYYFYVSGSNHYYILLENGKTVENALKEMINYKTNINDTDENINVYNSAMKGYLDNWYKKNLTSYASYLDNNAVFCNDRSVANLGGWDSSGENIFSYNIVSYLSFKQSTANKDLNCINETDRFSVSNSKAMLTYPIGILTEPERNLMTSNYAKTGQEYSMASPYQFSSTIASIRIVSTTGTIKTTGGSVYTSFGVRGVITLKPGTISDDGTGTPADPYVVGPIVERSN